MKIFMEVASTTNIPEIISSLGFPIFVAVYMLWKGHKDNQVLQDSMNKLENVIIELNTYLRTILDKKGN